MRGELRRVCLPDGVVGVDPEFRKSRTVHQRRKAATDWIAKQAHLKPGARGTRCGHERPPAGCRFAGCRLQVAQKNLELVTCQPVTFTTACCTSGRSPGAPR